MTAQHLRPLVAFVVVAIFGAVVFVNNLQTQAVLGVIRSGAVNVVAGNPLLHEPLFVVEEGRRLAPREKTGAEGASRGGSTDAAVTTTGGTTLGPSRDASPFAPAAGADGPPPPVGTRPDDGRPAALPKGDAAGGRAARNGAQEAEATGGQAGPQRAGATGKDHRGADEKGRDRGDRGDRDRGHRGEDRGHDRGDRGEQRGHDRGDRDRGDRDRGDRGEHRGHDRGDRDRGHHGDGKPRHGRR